MNIDKKNILVIDDSVTIRNVLKNMLQEAEYNVYEASDGEEGLELYKSLGNIDLIITDIYMPRKTGLELVMELKGDEDDVNVIILSDGGQYDFSNDSGICEALGAAHFLSKDLAQDELLELVDQMFKKNVDKYN